MQLEGFIPLQPKAWKRPGKFKGRRYDPSVADKRAFFEMCVIVAGCPEHPPEGDVWLQVEFVCEVKSGRRPDLDNLVKFVMDALNKTYWKDDAQICWLLAKRTFAREGVGTHLDITYVGD